MGLTRKDIKELKKAKCVAFFYEHGRSFMRCHLTDSEGNELLTEIDCGVETSGGMIHGEFDFGDVIHAFHPLVYSHVDEEWQSIASMLKAGDELTIKWRSCNDSYNLTKAGLHRDELFLVVRRTVRGKPVKLSFHVATSIGAHNSAKMIKHTASPKSILGNY